MGAVAVRVANYGSFTFNVPLELPSSSYYQVEYRVYTHPHSARAFPAHLAVLTVTI
jgi:hypothetical protein